MIQVPEIIEPSMIEKRSFEIIAAELPHPVSAELAPIVMRVIHTTADFDYLDNLCFSKNAVLHAKQALSDGVSIVTDTNMAKAGINKAALKILGGEVFCFMADEDVKTASRERGITRAALSMEKAAAMEMPLIFAIGNAPTALLKLRELILSEKLSRPALIIGAPVGFVNVVQSKELIMELDVPYIVARGRKGGSNVAAAICNALIYELQK